VGNDSQILTFLFEVTLIAVLLINLGLILDYFRTRKDDTRSLSDEYQAIMSSLIYTIQLYKSSKYFYELEKLKKTYDVDPNSKTKALNLFNQEHSKLLSQSAKEIYKMLSDDLKKIFMKYYTLDGLIYIITEELKK